MLQGSRAAEFPKTRPTSERKIGVRVFFVIGAASDHADILYKGPVEQSSADDAARRGHAETAGRVALVRLGLAIAAISLTPVLYRASPLGPTATSFYRTALALPVFLIWVWLERVRANDGAPGASRRDKISWLRDGPTLLMGGALYAANILAYAWAVRLTHIANASLLSNLTPIFVALGGFLMFRERVSPGFLLSMLAAIAGVGVLSSDKLGLSPGQILGDGLGLLSAASFAGYLIVIGRVGPRLSSATIMLWTGLFIALDLFAAALLAGESLLPATLFDWWSLVALGVVSFALGQGLLTVAMTHVGATFAAVSLLALPVSAAFYGWLLLGEALSARQGIGGAIILASILGARLSQR